MKFEIGSELALLLRTNDRMAFRSGRGPGGQFPNYNHAGIVARLLLMVLHEDDPDRVAAPDFPWLDAFDLAAVSLEASPLDGSTWFGQRVDRRFRIDDDSTLLVGSFRNGGRFQIAASGGWKRGEIDTTTPSFTLSAKEADLVARTILAHESSLRP